MRRWRGESGEAATVDWWRGRVVSPSYWRVLCRIRDRPSPYEGPCSRAAPPLGIYRWCGGRKLREEHVAGGGKLPAGEEHRRDLRERERERRPGGGSWLVWFGATSLGWGSLA